MSDVLGAFLFDTFGELFVVLAGVIAVFGVLGVLLYYFQALINKS